MEEFVVDYFGAVYLILQGFVIVCMIGACFVVCCCRKYLSTVE